MTAEEKLAKIREYATAEYEKAIAVWSEADPSSNTEAFYDGESEAFSDLLDYMDELDNA